MIDPIEPKRLVFPFVAPLYRALQPYVYPLVRISLGAILMPHGFDKLFLGGAANTARNPILKIFGNPLAGAYFIGCVEFFGGLLLVLGLLTRFAAGAIAIGLALAGCKAPATGAAAAKLEESSPTLGRNLVGARKHRVGGTSRPNAPAVLGLMTNSHLVGTCTSNTPLQNGA